ncbi:histone-lysine N-methyltransferase PRDM9-like [Cydia pomonella]|uniref:histone-lysine N-methyltransferase PRDM9-like n=1 Tax=Cydia pomonella TaxID=82600 RepID=UPI002ADE2DC1|nr:histone-lysine N-methyltransferase PRDM9-like [Cydia pomonella]
MIHDAGAGIGVFSTLTLPSGVRFGPYRGLKTRAVTSSYCWQIFDRERKPSHVLDARDANKSNWMRYVNCSRHFSEQNLVAFQYQGQLYYRTIKIIPSFTELLVFYGSEFASELRVDLRRYHAPCTQTLAVKCEAENDVISKILHEEKLITETSVDNKENVHIPEPLEVAPIYDENKCSSEGEFLKSHLNEQNENISQNENNNSNNRQIVDGKPIINDITDSYVKNVATNIDNKVKTYSCPICEGAFLNKWEFINHDIKIHNSKKNYKACTICDYKTERNGHLKQHMETHNTLEYKCDICEYKTPYSKYLQRHAKTHEKFTCKICKDKFETSKKLQTHLILHQEKTYDCTICKLTFHIESEFITHFKTHTEQRLHKCTICGKPFRTPSCVRRHMMTHSQDKPYTCEICKSGFRQPYRLKRHMKVHSNEKPEVNQTF